MKKCWEIRKKMVRWAVKIWIGPWCLNYGIQKSDTFHPTGSVWSIITASWLSAKKSVLHNYYDLTFMTIINRPWDLGLYNVNKDSLSVLQASQWELTCCSLYNLKFWQADCSVFHQISHWFLAWLILSPWRWKQRAPPKRRLTFNGLYGVIYQKTELFISWHFQ
jgi:hypothetical protein